jgi:hypothetical protein
MIPVQEERLRRLVKNVGDLDAFPVSLVPHSQGVKTASERSIEAVPTVKICPILN